LAETAPANRFGLCLVCPPAGASPSKRSAERAVPAQPTNPHRARSALPDHFKVEPYKERQTHSDDDNAGSHNEGWSVHLAVSSKPSAILLSLASHSSARLSRCATVKGSSTPSRSRRQVTAVTRRRIGSSSIGDKAGIGEMFHVGRLDGYWFRNWNDAAKKLQNDVELVNAKMANLVAPDLLEAAHAPTRCDGRRRNRSASCRSG